MRITLHAKKNPPVTHSNGKSLDIKTSRLNPSANASVQDIYIIYLYTVYIYVIIYVVNCDFICV
jgi:hypothetical protein